MRHLLIFWTVIACLPVQGQLGNARRAAERVANANEQRQRRLNVDDPAPDPSARRAPPAPNRPPTPPPPPPPAKVDPAKAAADKELVRKKLVASQTERAEAGSAVAQYDLGVRFLTGDGVEKNEQRGREWIRKSADQGNSDAIKKLKELDDNKIKATK